MTISAVATSAPVSGPPYVDVTVAVPGSNVTSELALYRNDSNGRSLVRTQPAAGFTSRTVRDYECPYEESVTYDWTATYTDPTVYTTLFDELWASLAAWTQSGGVWSVSGGKARATGVSSPMRLSRAVTAGKYRVTISPLTTAAAGDQINVALSSGPLGLTATDVQIIKSHGVGIYVLAEQGGVPVTGLTLTSIDPTQAIVVDFNSTSITVSNSGGSITIPVSFNFNTVSLDIVTQATSNTVQFGEIKVQSYGVTTTLAQTSTPVTLSPSNAWLIHPGAPAKSCPMTNTVTEKAGIRSLGTVQAPTNRTMHTVLGAKKKVASSSGPRSGDEVTMTVFTYSADEFYAMKALLADDIPLLIQVPPSWGFDFTSGFYSVDTTAADAQVDDLYQDLHDHLWMLPLTETLSPVVDVENSGWSWAALAAEFPTWAAVQAAFATWDDLLANNRR